MWSMSQDHVVVGSRTFTHSWSCASSRWSIENQSSLPLISSKDICVLSLNGSERPIVRYQQWWPCGVVADKNKLCPQKRYLYTCRWEGLPGQICSYSRHACLELGRKCCDWGRWAAAIKAGEIARKPQFGSKSELGWKTTLVVLVHGMDEQ